MFDSFFNVIIVIIALTVFIGRTIYQVRAKRREESPEQQQRQAIFEDDEEDNYRDLAYYVEQEEKKAKEAAPKKAAPKKVSTERLLEDTGLIQTPISQVLPPRPVVSVQAQSGGLQNLKLLTPLKQAVVMAEVLGTPKGLQEI